MGKSNKWWNQKIWNSLEESENQNKLPLQHTYPKGSTNLSKKNPNRWRFNNWRPIREFKEELASTKDVDLKGVTRAFRVLASALLFYGVVQPENNLQKIDAIDHYVPNRREVPREMLPGVAIKDGDYSNGTQIIKEKFREKIVRSDGTSYKEVNMVETKIDIYGLDGAVQTLHAEVFENTDRVWELNMAERVCYRLGDELAMLHVNENNQTWKVEDECVDEDKQIESRFHRSREDRVYRKPMEAKIPLSMYIESGFNARVR